MIYSLSRKDEGTWNALEALSIHQAKNLVHPEQPPPTPSPSPASRVGEQELKSSSAFSTALVPRSRGGGARVAPEQVTLSVPGELRRANQLPSQIRNRWQEKSLDGGCAPYAFIAIAKVCNVLFLGR